MVAYAKTDVWGRFVGTIAMALLGFLLAACSAATPGVGGDVAGGTAGEADSTVAEAPPTAADESEGAEAVSTPLSTFSPGQLALCEDLTPDVLEALSLEGARLTTAGAGWVDMADGTGREGCEIGFSGPGAELGVGPNSYMEPAHTLRRLFEDLGWTEDLAYAADGPGASVFGYREGENVCVANVSFSPPEGVDCPEDEPITCGLPPEEHEYSIRVTCAASGSGDA